MKNKILFIFNFGSEIRQFAYSGVISELLDNGNDVYISLRVNNKEVLSCIDKRAKILNYYRQGLPFYLNLLKEVLDSQANTSTVWKYMSDNKKFKSKINKIIYFTISSILKNVIKINVFKKIFEQIELKLFFSLHSQAWTDLLRENTIDKIIVNVPNYNYHLLATAKAQEIPIYLLFHTNKDLYTLGRILPFYTYIGVWNESMKNELLTINPKLKNNHVQAIGCTHFTNFVPQSNVDTKVRNKFDLQKDEMVILYIAAAPFVVSNEYEYVSLLQENIEDIGINDYKIIIKVNPMDDTQYWDKFLSEKVLIQNSEWAWNKEDSFNYPEKSDIENFIELLQISKLCVGLPSTVVIEASLMRVPFLNICFDYGDVTTIYNTVAEMWTAPFYRNVVTMDSAIGVLEKAMFKKKLKEILIEDQDIGNKQDMFIKKELTFTGSELKNQMIKFLGNID